MSSKTIAAVQSAWRSTLTKSRSANSDRCMPSMNEKPMRRPSNVISGSARSKKSSLVIGNSFAHRGGATLRL